MSDPLSLVELEVQPGNLLLTCPVPSMTDPSFPFRENDVIALQADTGKFLSRWGPEDIKAAKNSVDEFCQFTISLASKATSKDIFFGLGVKYDDGVTPSVTINDGGTVVEVHKSQSASTLWYRVGKVQANNTISWGGSSKYDDGVSPSVAIRADGTVVEVHKSQSASTLWYRVGKVQANNTISWGGSSKYDDGVSPSVAIRADGTVVEVHKSQSASTLWYRVGKVQANNTISWGGSSKYDDGVSPSVAIGADRVIETHRSQSYNTLWCRVGTVQGDNTITWGLSRKYDEGINPSVAINSYIAVQTHESQNLNTLWYSAALAIDRTRWMEDRLSTLGARRLKELVLPASHDSGMYLGSGVPAFARTQDLNIYEQLKAGIRYFDLRPKWTNSDIVIHHGPVSGPLLSEVLYDVQRFMKEGHKELIIFKLSHYDSFDNGVYATMIQQIQNSLRSWLFARPLQGKRLGELTLQDFVGSGGKVLVVCDDNYPVDVPAPGIWVYRDWSSSDPGQGQLRVFDQYANSDNYETMKSDQLTKFANYTGRCQYVPAEPCDLFLLSWTCTPLTDVWDASKEPNRNLGAVMAELQQPNTYGQIVNLLYVDFVEYARVTDIAVGQNQRSLVH